MRADVLVVGSGVAGMTASVLMAAAGRSVILVESHRSLAPTIRGFTRGGRHFDTGLHYLGGLGEGDPLRTYFTHLGLMPELKPVAYDPAGFDAVRFGDTGEEFFIPSGRAALDDALARRFPNERSAIAEYLDAVERVFDASPYLNFSLPYSLDASRHGEIGSLAARLSKLTKDERLKTILTYPCLLYGVAPEEAPFTIHALVAGSYYRSVHSLEGGGTALVQAYRRRLGDLGVEFVCRAGVRRISITQEGFAGVELNDGRKVQARTCVWAAHPAAMVDAAPAGSLREPYRQRVLGLQSTGSALMLFCESDSPLPELSGRNLLLWPGGGFAEKLSGRVPMKENAVFLFAGQGGGEASRSVTIIASMDPTRFAPWVDTNTGARPTGYRQEKLRLMDALLMEAESRCPTLVGRLTPVDGATPLTLRDWCQAPNGAMYGAKHSTEQFNPQPLTRIRGLLLCGQSIVAPGVLGAMISAYLSCGFLLGHEVLHRQLQDIA
ncbi:MAG: NAD(P)-binding protein [Proteobacteria bacterium]|nr:NAD(P)-binding protein [Pseudomonadota bacterium]MBU1595079.1 NAD(P)-binding protein [Pseudomonadota bacterium]